MNKNDIIKLFKDFGCAITADDIWQVQSATVIKHKALERLAASAKIEFEAPTIIRANADEAVILVTGSLYTTGADEAGRQTWKKARTEWSIGEALVNVNYRVSGKQAAYVYAMAEKRAKDRVILKLAGLHGLYSEDEADEFKEQARATPVKEQVYGEELDMALTAMLKNKTRAELRAWIGEQKEVLREILSEIEYQRLRHEYAIYNDSLPLEKEAA